MNFGVWKSWIKEVCPYLVFSFWETIFDIKDWKKVPQKNRPDKNPFHLQDSLHTTLYLTPPTAREHGCGQQECEDSWTFRIFFCYPGSRCWKTLCLQRTHVQIVFVVQISTDTDVHQWHLQHLKLKKIFFLRSWTFDERIRKNFSTNLRCLKRNRKVPVRSDILKLQSKLMFLAC